MIGEVFDPNAEFSIRETCKPHWSQTGAVVFITFRTCDSIPNELVTRWHRQKCDWLVRRDHMDLGQTDWKSALKLLDPELRFQFNREFNRLRENFLDRCEGACVLRQPELAKIVADSLMMFDAERYSMGDFIVMPNHVHLLAAFPSEVAMQKQCTSWTHYTAREINRSLFQSGHFWQADPFDHLVRSSEQYDYLRRYIRDNPKKSGLKDGEYRYRRSPN